MNAKYAMNHNTTYKTSSDMSQDMLILNGQLYSGMERGDSSHYYQNNLKNQNKHKSQFKDPNHYRQYEPTPNVAYSRGVFNRFGNIIQHLQPVNDEMRKKPFTVPTVRVQIASQSPMQISNAKTGQSRISYID